MNGSSVLTRTMSNARYLLPSHKPKVGYIGWLGHANLGDEALFEAFHLLFSDVRFLPYKNTAKIQAVERYLKYPIYRAGCLGGGTLVYANGSLEDFKTATNLKCGSFVFGTGVRQPVFWEGRSQACNSYEAWHEVLKRCRYIGVRGPLSKELLLKGGLEDVEIIGDPVLSLARLAPAPRKRSGVLGVNIGVANGLLWGGDESRVLDEVVTFLRLMIKEGWRIRFLPVCPGDLEYIEAAIHRLGGRTDMFRDYLSIKSVLSFMDECDYFIGEKLHSVVFAACAHVPSLMIEYRPKCMDFMMSLGLEAYTLRTDELSSGLLTECFGRLEHDGDLVRQRMIERVTRFAGLQRERAQWIQKVLIN